MLIRIHNATRLAVALCDSELLGKIFEEGERQLDLTGKFFQGEEKNKEEIKELLKFYKMEDACFNIIGNESCKVAIEAGLIYEKDVSNVAGIPFILILW
jgi:hypothetical protein